MSQFEQKLNAEARLPTSIRSLRQAGRRRRFAEEVGNFHLTLRSSANSASLRCKLEQTETPPFVLQRSNQSHGGPDRRGGFNAKSGPDLLSTLPDTMDSVSVFYRGFVETAAIVLIAILQYELGDLSQSSKT